MARPRRKSSGLTGDPRGDTGGPAVSTLEPMPTIVSPPLSPRPSSGFVPRPSKRRRVRSYIRRWKIYTFKHTWVNPLIVIAIVLLFYAVNPTESNPLHRALFLSYPLPRGDPLIPSHARNDPDVPTYYGKGLADVTFVCFYIVVLSFTREFLMQRFIRPVAIHYGIRSRAKQFRFMEQAYTAMYFSVFGPYGMYVMSRTPVWYFSTHGMYEGFPHKSHDGLFKAYYLLQASYWAQQAIVLLLQLEKPRKDFKELVAHHIITLSLIASSYRFHFTYMGIAVYITHDISDLFLASSKTLNYLDSPITVPYYTFFVGVWIYLRHYINLKILYSILTSFTTVGPYELNWETQQYKCSLSQAISFALLGILQLINLFWLVLILRIALNIFIRDDSTDTRSEDEDSAAEEERDDAAVRAEKREVVDKARMAVGGAGGMNGKVGMNGRQKAPPPPSNGFSSALDRERVLNGSAVESAPGTPQSPTARMGNAHVEAVLKRR